MKKLLSVLCLTFGMFYANAQNAFISGSYETLGHRYFNDSANSFNAPSDRFASNNYLKMDYYSDMLTAGLQMESYAPGVIGFPSELSGHALTGFYASFEDESFNGTIGTFYEQFGSGLLFRSWEDRALGFNNSVMGARLGYNFGNNIQAKMIWGRPRLGMEFTQTQLRGADLFVDISGLAGWEKIFLNMEAAALSRYEPLDIDMEEDGADPQTNGYMGNISLSAGEFSIKAEYVDGGKKYFYSGSELLNKRGNAQLIEASYMHGELGMTMTARRLEWMEAKASSSSNSVANLINYIPAVTNQYSHMLANLHPYNPETGRIMGGYVNSGEMGGQIDLYYHFGQNAVHANVSNYHAIREEGSVKMDKLLFFDASADIEHKWSKKLKTNLMYSFQKYNTSYGMNNEFRIQNILSADALYKINKTLSVKGELQYLHTKQDEKDWMAGLLECNFAPHWSLFGSDMFNHGSSKLHYYNIGMSYSVSRSRLAFGYGRFREGVLCSGGVCRTVPAYTGGNLTFTTSF